MYYLTNCTSNYPSGSGSQYDMKAVLRWLTMHPICASRTRWRCRFTIRYVPLTLLACARIHAQLKQAISQILSILFFTFRHRYRQKNTLRMIQAQFNQALDSLSLSNFMRCRHADQDKPQKAGAEKCRTRYGGLLRGLPNVTRLTLWPA